MVHASVMPYITNGNIHAPVMTIAEKTADLILGNTPLPPEPVAFCRRASRGHDGANAGPFGGLEDPDSFSERAVVYVAHHNVGFFTGKLDRPAITSP